MIDWIPVDEKLPCVGEFYPPDGSAGTPQPGQMDSEDLILTNCIEIWVGHLTYDQVLGAAAKCWHWRINGLAHGSDTLEMQEVTHWARGEGQVPCPWCHQSWHPLDTHVCLCRKCGEPLENTQRIGKHLCI